MKKALVLLLVAMAALQSCKSSKYADLGDGIFASIETNKGDMILQLEYQKTPITVANFITLAEGSSPYVADEYKGKKYYDGLIFHRVIKDFMIQGGDPTGTGSGNPGYRFQDEFNDSLKLDRKGILAMANSGPRTNGSQFFITLKETPWLNGVHTVFGHLVKGQEVLDSIGSVKTATGDRPVETQTIQKVEIIRNGREAKNFDAVQVMKDYFEKEKNYEAEIQKVKTDFLKEVAQQKEEAEELPSGLKVYKLYTGEGEKPKPGQKVYVNYAGWLIDGTLFDTSEKTTAAKFGELDKIEAMHRGDFSPVPMDYSPDARMIPGFKEGLLTMKVGDRVRLFIPPHLAYGANGAGNVIPPNADLIFDLEVTGIMQ